MFLWTITAIDTRRPRPSMEKLGRSPKWTRTRSCSAKKTVEAVLSFLHMERSGVLYHGVCYEPTYACMVPTLQCPLEIFVNGRSAKIVCEAGSGALFVNHRMDRPLFACSTCRVCCCLPFLLTSVLCCEKKLYKLCCSPCPSCGKITLYHDVSRQMLERARYLPCHLVIYLLLNARQGASARATRGARSPCNERDCSQSSIRSRRLANIYDGWDRGEAGSKIKSRAPCGKIPSYQHFRYRRSS